MRNHNSKNSLDFHAPTNADNNKCNKYYEYQAGDFYVLNNYFSQKHGDIDFWWVFRIDTKDYSWFKAFMSSRYNSKQSERPFVGIWHAGWHYESFVYFKDKTFF